MEPLNENSAAAYTPATGSTLPELYTVVPMQTTLPAHIPHDAIEQLYLFNEDDADQLDPEDP